MTWQVLHLFKTSKLRNWKNKQQQRNESVFARNATCLALFITYSVHKLHMSPRWLEVMYMIDIQIICFLRHYNTCTQLMLQESFERIPERMEMQARGTCHIWTSPSTSAADWTEADNENGTANGWAATWNEKKAKTNESPRSAKKWTTLVKKAGKSLICRMIHFSRVGYL